MSSTARSPRGPPNGKERNPPPLHHAKCTPNFAHSGPGAMGRKRGVGDSGGCRNDVGRHHRVPNGSFQTSNGIFIYATLDLPIR